MVAPASTSPSIPARTSANSRWARLRRFILTSTFKFLGNIGTVSLPLTAALAEEREFLKPGDSVSLLGIGSGLTCMMLGIDW